MWLVGDIDCVDGLVVGWWVWLLDWWCAGGKGQWAVLLVFL